MNEKEVLVHIIDIENDTVIRADYTSIPSEMLKMYHYMMDKDGLYLYLDEPIDGKIYDDKYICADLEVKDVSVTPAGDGYLNCINVYVKVI